MVRTLIFTAAIALGTCAVSEQAQAFHGQRRACGGGYGYRAPVTSYYAPSRYSGYQRAGSVYSSGYGGYGYGYQGYSNPGYGYRTRSFGANPYGYSGYRGGGISIGFGSGLGSGYGGLGGYGGYGYPGYGFGW